MQSTNIFIHLVQFSRVMKSRVADTRGRSGVAFLPLGLPSPRLAREAFPPGRLRSARASVALQLGGEGRERSAAAQGVGRRYGNVRAAEALISPGGADVEAKAPSSSFSLFSLFSVLFSLFSFLVRGGEERVRRARRPARPRTARRPWGWRRTPAT